MNIYIQLIVNNCLMYVSNGAATTSRTIRSVSVKCSYSHKSAQDIPDALDNGLLVGQGPCAS